MNSWPDVPEFRYTLALAYIHERDYDTAYRLLIGYFGKDVRLRLLRIRLAYEQHLTATAFDFCSPSSKSQSPDCTLKLAIWLHISPLANQT